MVLGLAERKELAGDAAAHGECVASLDQILDEETTSQQLQQVYILYTSPRSLALLRRTPLNIADLGFCGDYLYLHRNQVVRVYIPIRTK